jgi:hypothetical protein
MTIVQPRLVRLSDCIRMRADVKTDQKDRDQVENRSHGNRYLSKCGLVSRGIPSHSTDELLSMPAQFFLDRRSDQSQEWVENPGGHGIVVFSNMGRGYTFVVPHYGSDTGSKHGPENRLF